VLAPSKEGHCQTSASRHLRRCPKRQQGVAPAKLPLLERLPMSTRNGTPSVADPQPQQRPALPLGEVAGEKEEVRGDGSDEH
jgi:hypothetical protein